ncbi:MAG: hypothetical protein QNJ34_03450 [Xenococcaceae cyanobacterium MO_188.B29]|nr:hypothetical protein [Xenococcaceae cyanobacterium MO_188.B29]
MKNILVDKAKKAGLYVIEDFCQRWIIEGIAKNKKLWLLEEQETGTWLIKVDRIPEAVLDTETAIAILDNKFFVG